MIKHRDNKISNICIPYKNTQIDSQKNIVRIQTRHNSGLTTPYIPISESTPYDMEYILYSKQKTPCRLIITDQHKNILYITTFTTFPWNP